MPRMWSESTEARGRELRLVLWPHRSMPRAGQMAAVAGAYAIGTIPLYGLLGTSLFWGVLPGVLLAVALLWWGLERSRRDGRTVEELAADRGMIRLVRTEPDGSEREWSCHSRWARVTLHRSEGPVPNYVTLRGMGREVEIGAFLSEDERVALHGELLDALASLRSK